MDLLSDPIRPTLRRLTGPVVVGLLAMFSFSLADTFFVSLLGELPLAAISFTFPVTFALISLTIGLSIATSALVAHAVGRSDQERASRVATTALVLTLVAVGLLALIGALVQDPLFRAMGASGAILSLIHDYMNWWFAGCVLLALPMVGNAVFRARGDTRLPSLFMLVGGLVNIVLDPLLIFGVGPLPRLEMAGAAIASVISWLVGSLLVLVMLKRRQLLAPLSRVSRELLRRLLAIAVPASAANMLTPLAMAVLTAMVAQHGPLAVAAFGVNSRIETMATVLILALSMSLPPLVAQNHAAGLGYRAAEGYNQAIRFVLWWQALVYLLLALVSPLIAQAFASSSDGQALVQQVLLILPLCYGAQGVIILSNSTLNALQRPATALLASVARFFLLVIPGAWLGSHWFGLTGLFAGMVVGTLLMALLSWQICRRLFNTSEGLA
ncbi:MAG: MATE family efflux transporter [Gammaproteobacteria bacterium]|nr:MATE family efflux transporter [Gammaproteobacteria bacterium]